MPSACRTRRSLPVWTMQEPRGNNYHELSGEIIRTQNRVHDSHYHCSPYGSDFKMNKALQNQQTSNQFIEKLVLAPIRFSSATGEAVGYVQEDKLEKHLQGTKAGPKDEWLKTPDADNQKALGGLETQIGNFISQRMKPSEDKLREVDGEVSGFHRTVGMIESRHVETTKSLMEVHVLTKRIQTQVNDQGQEMAEQSANGLNRINDRLQGMYNQSGLTGQKLKEFNAGNQNLLEKVLSMDGNLSERLLKQKQTGSPLINGINELGSSNSESVSSIQLRLGDMDKESKDNIKQIVNLQETINIQAERVNAVDADRQKAAEKARADLESTVASKAKAIADLRNELRQSIVSKFRPAKDRFKSIDEDIQGLNKIEAVLEQEHPDTAESKSEKCPGKENLSFHIDKAHTVSDRRQDVDGQMPGLSFACKVAETPRKGRGGVLLHQL